MAMQVKFPEKEIKTVIEKLKTALGGRELGKMVSFDQQGNNLLVTISKFGTSTLEFAQQPSTDGLHMVMSKEKIALAHKALKNEVTEKIIKVIEQAGGKVTP